MNGNRIPSTKALHFFLGGYDLEMLEIRKLLEEKSLSFTDKALRWGAKISDYGNQIQETLRSGFVPVLIELKDDTEDGISTSGEGRVVVVDHHGDRAGTNQPTALEQVALLVGVSAEEFAANRDWQLVAANDRGHIAGMRRLDPPASDEEIRDVRMRDLSAQGIDDAMLAAAQWAVGRAETRLDGRLTVMTIDNDRLSLAAEVMEPIMGGPGYENLWVRGKSESGFYGNGKVVLWLADQCGSQHCWYGGELPTHGFWGASQERLPPQMAQRVAQRIADL